MGRIGSTEGSTTNTEPQRLPKDAADLSGGADSRLRVGLCRCEARISRGHGVHVQRLQERGEHGESRVALAAGIQEFQQVVDAGRRLLVVDQERLQVLLGALLAEEANLVWKGIAPTAVQRHRPLPVRLGLIHPVGDGCHARTGPFPS